LRHVCTFAFESLSTLLRLPVPIDLPSVEQKVLLDGRGGYCYELNQLFLELLQELGFDARGITGRVVMGGPPDAHTARTHRLSLVTVDGVRYICDVGFGGMVPSSPLRLDSEAIQATAHEPFRLTVKHGSYTLWADVGGEWRGLYVFDLQVQADIDYEIGNWYVSTHADSPFLGELMLAYTVYQLSSEIIEGVVDLAEGQYREAAEHVVSVTSEVVQLGTFAAGAAVGGALRRSLFVDDLRVVEVNGQPRRGTRIWRPMPGMICNCRPMHSPTRWVFTSIRTNASCA